MRKTRNASPYSMQTKRGDTSKPEIDYSLKTPSLCDQIVFGIKLFAACGAFFLLIWLYEKFLI
jgi:hypothetical protein